MPQSRVPWRWSLLTALLVTYHPFLAVAAYMWLFVVACGGHCKETILWLLPVGPGFICAYVSLAWLESLTGLSWRLEWIQWAVAGTNSLVAILIIASTGRLGRSWLVGAAVAAFFIFGGQAVILLNPFQM